LIAGGPAKQKPDAIATIEPSATVRAIDYREKELSGINTRFGYTTLFVLPKSERIMTFVCATKTTGHQWAENFAYLKPEKDLAPS
jgi:hypothetical protein